MAQYKPPAYVSELANISGDRNMFTNGYAMYERNPLIKADIDAIAALIGTAFTCHRFGDTATAATLMEEADRKGRLTAERLRPYLGSRVAISATLGLVRQLVELRVMLPDVLRNRAEHSEMIRRARYGGNAPEGDR